MAGAAGATAEPQYEGTVWIRGKFGTQGNEKSISTVIICTYNESTAWQIRAFKVLFYLSCITSSEQNQCVENRVLF